MKIEKKTLIFFSSAIILIAIAITTWIFFFYNPLENQISKIDIDLKVYRFDQDLQQINNENYNKNIESIQSKYGDFFEIYNKEIIGIGSINNASYYTFLKTFLNDYSVIEANKAVNNIYKDFSKTENNILNAYKHYKYYFPENKIYNIYTFTAGFNQSIVIGNDFIGVGLDKYLGYDCKLYDMLNIPDYSKLEMTEDNIPIDIMTAIFEDAFPILSNKNLLDNIIYNGIKLVFLKHIFPNCDETIIFKYTEEQLNYCNKYEREMWTNLVENKLLFSTDYMTIKKFTTSAPFTYQFGPQSPPRTANWLGYKIVNTYMKNNNIDIKQIVETKNYQEILNLSGYNPKY